VWRLATRYLLTTLSILLVLGGSLYLLTRLYVYQQLERELAAQADFYAAYASQLAADEQSLAVLAPSLVQLFSARADLNVRIFASNGTLLAATQEIGPQPSRAAWQALAYRSPTLFTQPSRDLPGRRYAAQPILGQNTVRSSGFSRPPLGVAEVSRSTRANERTLTALGRILALTALVATFLTLGVSVLLARQLSRPIHEMEQATQRIVARRGPDGTEIAIEERGPDELRRLAASINHMARQLHELEASRTRFIGEIAHDLRTPLTAIKGLLANEIDAADHPDPALALAEQETDRLIRLVNQLLDLARWQGGQLSLRLRPTDLNALACQAVALYQERAQHLNVSLTAACAPNPPILQADPDRLERAMINMIDNALRFTPGGGQVTVSVAYHQPSIPGPSRGKAEVSVLDTGRGITPDERQRAFEIYYSGAGGGTGLGLTITQAIVHAHGGEIGIESPADEAHQRGTRAWFTVPL
jgi:signal transduction histidine kinase